MVMNDTLNDWICTMEIENSQQDFAKSLQMILWLEEIAQNGPIDDIIIPKQFIPFYISRTEGARINSQETLIKQENLINSGTFYKYKKITSGEMFLDGLKKEVKQNVFNYYFRIEMNESESDITELQYLVLLLQTVPDISNRVAVRLMGSETMKWNTNNYFRVSHFLRFIQMKYKCFYACYNENLISLVPLQKYIDSVQTTFFPLLEVDGQICQILNKTWFLDSKYENQSYDKLYSVILPRGCSDDDMTKLLFEIGFRILFKSMSGRKFGTQKKKQYLLDNLCKLVEDIQGVTPLDILLFAALAGTVKGIETDFVAAKALLGNIQILSLSISQVLENIVNHSERNRGVFTYRLQKILTI